jgi:hypothetical protein
MTDLDRAGRDADDIIKDMAATLRASGQHAPAPPMRLELRVQIVLSELRRGAGPEA